MQTDADERALRNFSDGKADLELLEQLLTAANNPTNDFDLLQVIRPGLWEYEDVHSNIIAWLLDPQQSHNIGQYFLKNFLFETCKTANALGGSAITPATIHSIDWLQTEVRREWRYIDILILNRKARFVCAIENKIFAGEGIGDDGISQLTWYRKTLAEEFPAYTRHLVFLDLKSGQPSEHERRFWTPENYGTVLELLVQTLERQASTLKEDVLVFLRQYATTLRTKGNVVPESNEIAELARKIYLEHREAIEVIYGHKPNYRDDMKELFKEAFMKQRGWELDHEYPAYIGFRPMDWQSLYAFDTGTWWLSKSLLAFQFYHLDHLDRLPSCTLYISQGTDEKARAALLERINQNPEIFNRTGRSHTNSSISVDVRDGIIDESDLSRWDGPSPRAKIEAWVKDFAENGFPAMNEVIVNCLREYEAETKGQ